MKAAIEASGRLRVKEGKGFGPMTLCYRIHKIGRIHRSENPVTPVLLVNPVDECDECRQERPQHSAGAVCGGLESDKPLQSIANYRKPLPTARCRN